ncbi:NAD(P)/FAD-dependent oxidoreductase [Paraburkholderia sp.]|uniref:NAD(P)/FAD-dependent oxidoreductase n=1 Tax=Paraburkholderia sp. TaxID=1926495 RepID=UPI003D6DCD15
MMEDAVIVGGGPAGVACALWLHQLGLRVMLLEAGPTVGGLQLRSPYMNRWIPGVLGQSGQQVAGLLQEQLCAASVPHTVGFKVTSIRRADAFTSWEVSNGSRMYRARHVVIATGSKPRRAGFVESECVGIGPGMSMERIPVKGRRVAILGGGDNAYDQADSAMRRGAACVDIYCRRPPQAQPLLQRLIDARHVHVGPFDADQARMTVNGISYDVLGVQFGFDACIPGGLDIPLRKGCIVVDQQGAVSSLPRIYAAGEVTNYWHPCVTTSFAQGIQVAKSIQTNVMADEAENSRNASQRIQPLRVDLTQETLQAVEI